MNEEIPPLRLKPRLRPESPAPLPPPTDPAPGAAADPLSTANEAPLAGPERAKPRLNLPTPDPLPERLPSSTEIALEPAGESSGAVKPWLRADDPVPRPPLPAKAETEVSVTPVRPPMPNRPEEKPAFKFGVFLVLLLAVVVIGGGAIVAMRLIKKSIAKPAPPQISATVATHPAPPLPVEAPPPALVDHPVSSIGKTLARAQEATSRATEQSRLTEIIPTATETASETATEHPEPDAGTEPLPALPKAPQPSHGQVVATSSATPAFIAFVEAARISGVFQGNPARALINGRTVRTGGIVDPILGATFYRLDTDGRWVVFRDATGALVKKGY